MCTARMRMLPLAGAAGYILEEVHMASVRAINTIGFSFTVQQQRLDIIFDNIVNMNTTSHCVEGRKDPLQLQAEVRPQ